MKYLSVVPWVLVVCSCVHLALCSTIALQDRGYTGVVVVIHDSVIEDDELVPNLKALFTNASKFLYSSTNNGVYFKEVTIVVPRDWSRKPGYEAVSGIAFSSADVRVDAANDVYGDAPYTQQFGGCGEPGQYIHLTPWFVKEVDKVTEMFGKPERQFVHEWAHLRYGVFDEYGIPGDQRYPTFYVENNEVLPTTCTNGIPGWTQLRNGGKCSILPNGQVDEDCVFIPDMKVSAVKASIMYMPFFPSIEEFCDEETPHRKHNTKAPTRQNRQCNYESTWSVISRHKDFQNIGNGRPAVVPGTLDPKFRVIQPPRYDKGRFVLVLDVSGSMNGTKIQLLHQTASRLVEDRIPDEAKLGIVQFSTEAQVLHWLTTVSSKTRTTLSKSLPKEAYGSTAIGQGLLKAIEVLQKGNTSPEGGVIILVTDGEENVLPFIQEVTTEITNKKVIVNAVAFGSGATAKIEDLSSTTGGKSFFFADVNGKRPPSALDSAFMESVTVQSNVQEQPQRLKDETFDLQDKVTKKTIHVDNDLGKNTIFTVTSRYIGKVEISLSSPIGDTYNSKSWEYNRDDNRRERIQVSFLEARGGIWTLTLTRQGDTSFPVAFSVTSQQRSASIQPIIVRSRLSYNDVKFPNPIKVYAEVQKGSKAVIGATVVATVDGPKAQVEKITLRDNGAGADATKDDGIYSGYFTNFTGNGRYAVVAEVVNDGSARLKNRPNVSKAQSIPKAKGHFSTKSATSFPLTDFKLKENAGTEDSQDNGILAPVFERFTDCGSFLLHEWKANAGDVIPPADIRDLMVLSTAENYEEKTTKVTLQWTAVGDDLDSGNATSFELWACEDMDSFIKDVRSGFMIPEKNVTDGTLQPMSPGSLQSVTVLVSFPTASDMIYFAMRAKDKAGNYSPRQNIVAVNTNIKKVLMKPTTCGVVHNHYHYHYHYHYDKGPICPHPQSQK